MSTTARAFLTLATERLLTPPLLKLGFLISQSPLKVPTLVTCK